MSIEFEQVLRLAGFLLGIALIATATIVATLGLRFIFKKDKDNESE